MRIGKGECVKEPRFSGRQGHMEKRMAFKLIQIGAEKVKYICGKSS
jgi:hypothetical protein